MTSGSSWTPASAGGPASASPAAPGSSHGSNSFAPEESAYWLREFRDLDQSPETRKALNAEPSFFSDEEIAALEREIESEQE